MKKSFIIICLCVISGCSSKFVENQEEKVLSSRSVTSVSNLESLAAYSEDMSNAYFRAAQNTQTAQDLASFTVFLAAGSVVIGAVGETSDTVLAKRGVVGAAAQAAANSAVPKASIEAIFKGAKQMNCISTIARVGISLFSASDPSGTASHLAIKSARALTYGAINEVRISTYLGLTRDVAQYQTLVTAFTDAATPIDAFQVNTLNKEAGRNVDEVVAAINRYSKLLSNCLGAPQGSIEKVAVSKE